MVETLTSSHEFEHEPNHEIEQKFIPLFPEKLDRFRESAQPVEQFYLSHPSEEFSLRLRESSDDGWLVHTATLKSAGRSSPSGLDRLEVETPIDAMTYDLYKQQDVPTIKKLRAEPMKNIVVDFFEDGQVLIESENPISLAAFTGRYGLADGLAEVTGDRTADNEWRAHFTYRQEHGGYAALEPAEALNVSSIVDQLWRNISKSSLTTVAVCGRSGSGKSTLVKEITGQLEQLGIKSLVLSTDDYHRGKSWLEHHKGGPWTDWDDPIVYDTAELVEDLRRLSNGQSIVKRRFDFASEEPVFDGVISPASVVVIEGIYAGSVDVDPTFRYDLPTPLATCIGRRLLRDMTERPQFAEPSRSLRYMIEQAEPAYRRQLKEVSL
ncbi:MAG TPA: hypothetical protein VFL81_01555 [Candidatus Saccharimonadales bacterium]|nr:hypothetical protein [Candidatus Saccharimonadales bacterium]